MSGPFDKETEALLRRYWKALIAAAIPLFCLGLAAVVLIGLAFRSGSISPPDYAAGIRIAALIMFVTAFASTVLIRVGAIRSGLKLPIVRAMVPLMAFGLGLTFTGVDAGATFFSTAGEVIPVLLLALAIEGRAFSLDGLPSNHWLGREILKASILVTMFCLAAGEAIALAATAQESPSPNYTGVVAGALAAGFAGVMMYSMLGRLGQQADDLSPRRTSAGTRN